MKKENKQESVGVASIGTSYPNLHFVEIKKENLGLRLPSNAYPCHLQAQLEFLRNVACT